MGYLVRPFQTGLFTIELWYRVELKLVLAKLTKTNRSRNVSDREIGLLSFLIPRAFQLEDHRLPMPDEEKRPKLAVGNGVLVAYREVFRSLKSPAIKAKFYEPWRIFNRKKHRCALMSSTGRWSRKSILARKLLPYCDRGECLQELKDVSDEESSMLYDTEDKRE